MNPEIGFSSTPRLYYRRKSSMLINLKILDPDKKSTVTIYYNINETKNELPDSKNLTTGWNYYSFPISLRDFNESLSTIRIFCVDNYDASSNVIEHSFLVTNAYFYLHPQTCVVSYTLSPHILLTSLYTIFLIRK